MKKTKILIADDDYIFCELTKYILTEHKFSVCLAYNSQSTLDSIDHNKCDLILLDLQFPDFQTGINTLKSLKEKAKDIPVIIITSDNVNLTSKFPDLIQNGAFDIIEKPLQEERLLLTIKNTLKYSRLAKYNNNNNEMIYLIGDSPKINEVKSQILTTLQTDNHLIVYGNVGTGIRNIVRTFHQNSARANLPLFSLDCSKMTFKDMQNALFGDQEEKNMEKKFADLIIVQAQNSTLLIENIHLMPEKIQAKLVRTLSGRKLKSLGGKSLMDINVKLIFTAPKEHLNNIYPSAVCTLLSNLCQDKLVIPCLNERIKDIPQIIDHLIVKYNLTTDGNVSITNSAVKILMNHDWKENITGLKKVVLRVLHQIENEQITNRDISFHVDPIESFIPLPYKKAIKNFEKNYLTKIMEHNDWNLNAAADVLNIDRSNLFKKLQNHEIKIKKH